MFDHAELTHEEIERILMGETVAKQISEGTERWFFYSDDFEGIQTAKVFTGTASLNLRDLPSMTWVPR